MKKSIVLRPEIGVEKSSAVTVDLGQGLAAWAREYAAAHQTTVEQIVKDHLVLLRKKEQGEGVEQI